MLCGDFEKSLGHFPLIFKFKKKHFSLFSTNPKRTCILSLKKCLNLAKDDRLWPRFSFSSLLSIWCLSSQLHKFLEGWKSNFFFLILQKRGKNVTLSSLINSHTLSSPKPTHTSKDSWHATKARPQYICNIKSLACK